MKRSARLLPLVRAAEREERLAAAAFAGAREQLEAQRQRLEGLRAARQEYLAGPADSGGGGAADPRRLGRTRSFLARLDAAIAELSAQCERQGERCARERRRWLEARDRTRALDGVRARHRDTERAEVLAREQGHLDDLAGRPSSK